MRYSFGGVAIDLLTKKEAVNQVVQLADSGHDLNQVVTLNPEIMLAVWRDPVAADLINKAQLRLIDGVGLQLAVGLFSGRFIPRTPGADLVPALLAECTRRQVSVFLFGARPLIVERAAEAFARQHPHLKIAGVYHGFYRTPALIPAMVGASRARIIFIALGFPRQEQWGRAFRKNAPSLRVAMGVGGVFDYWGGGVRRAPAIIRGIGFEWLWRLVLQPWRWRRIFRAAIIFPLYVLGLWLGSSRTTS